MSALTEFVGGVILIKDTHTVREILDLFESNKNYYARDPHRAAFETCATILRFEKNYREEASKIPAEIAKLAKFYAKCNPRTSSAGRILEVL